jgi:hypothetical protein
VKTNLIDDDRGSSLIEVVAFAFVGFGLVLTLGFQMLETERKVLELQGISRNAMRAHLLDQDSDIFEEVSRLQSESRLLAEENITISITCIPATCKNPGTLVWVELKAEDLDAKAFGVKSG